MCRLKSKYKGGRLNFRESRDLLEMLFMSKSSKDRYGIYLTKTNGSYKYEIRGRGVVTEGYTDNKKHNNQFIDLYAFNNSIPFVINGSIQ